jgi:hypothetical protein
MNKKKALIILIKSSLFLGPTEKLSLLEMVNTMDNEQVMALGNYLASLRKASLENKNEMMEIISDRLDEKQNDKVYVGVGKPS